MATVSSVFDYCRSLLHYRCFVKAQGPLDGSRKVLYLEIDRSRFKRYLYTFIKFFTLCGYDVCVKPGSLLFYDLWKERYSRLLLEERLVRFAVPPKQVPVLQVNSARLSADYFRFLVAEADPAAFRVPMTQHPLMYHHGWWNSPIEATKRMRSVFMVGNFDPQFYQQVETDKLFNVASRVTIMSSLAAQGRLLQLKGLAMLQNFLAQQADNQVVLLDRRETDVPMPELRGLLARFDFYFALPGVVMPFSHNIIEAMSVGCIPLIQANYARLFQPALVDGKNAITFNDVQDLNVVIDRLFSLEDGLVHQMHREVTDYYDNFLVPAYTVAQVERNREATIYLQAEHRSVQLLRERQKVR